MIIWVAVLGLTIVLEYRPHIRDVSYSAYMN